jgi:fucose 4-O-acetylase-like acetyltransferase
MVRQMLPARYERSPLPAARPEKPPTDTPTTASATSPRAAGASGGKQRDPFFDNAKYLTILLVGMGHAWEPLAHDSRAVDALYFVVYTFHMPAFIVISGYLSRSFTGTPRQIKRLITGVAVPYLAFETLYTLFMRWADNPDREFSYQEPGFALWFLVALFIWRLSSPLWKSMRWPLPVALAIGTAAGVTPSIDDDLNLMRVLQFLPFFVLGLQLKAEHFAYLRRRALRFAAAPILLATVVFAYWAVDRMASGWLLHTKDASDLGVPSWVGATMYLALFGCSLLVVGCFFALVPRRRTWYTALGAGTITAYLLHVYVIKSARLFDWYDHPWVATPWCEVLITVAAAAMMTLLCTPQVQRTFRFVTEPRLEWFFRRDAVAQAREREKSKA